MKKAELIYRLNVLKRITDLVSGSGVDDRWWFIINWSKSRHYYAPGVRYLTDNHMEFRPKALMLSNSFHCMNEQGVYCGWAQFTIIFPNNKPLDEFRIEFNGPDAQRLQKKYDIKDYLDQLIYGAHHVAIEQEKAAQLPADTQTV